MAINHIGNLPPAVKGDVFISTVGNMVMFDTDYSYDLVSYFGNILNSALKSTSIAKSITTNNIDLNYFYLGNVITNKWEKG